MVPTIIGNPATPLKTIDLPACQMTPQERKQLALDAMARREPVTRLAQTHEVSRKFVYAQKDKAQKAVDEAFSEATQESEDLPLFYLPVTKRWIRGFVVSLALSCHAPYRGIIEVTKGCTRITPSPISVPDFELAKLSPGTVCPVTATCSMPPGK